MWITGVVHDKDAASDWLQSDHALAFSNSPHKPKLDSIPAKYALKRITSSALNDVRSAWAVYTAESPHNTTGPLTRFEDRI
jgi:hypothetical protein